MRYAWGKGRIERVEIDRHIERPVDARPRAGGKRLHLDYVDAEPCDLIPLVRRQRTDAHLHQPPAQLFFHDPREWAGVRIPIACELVVKIGVRVDVEDGDARMSWSDGAHDRIRDRMVAAERD